MDPCAVIAAVGRPGNLAIEIVRGAELSALASAGIDLA
jgi:hypothetical protein